MTHMQPPGAIRPARRDKERAAFVDLPDKDDYIVVQVPCGPSGAVATTIFHAGQQIKDKRMLELALAHDVPLRWR